MLPGNILQKIRDRGFSGPDSLLDGINLSGSEDDPLLDFKVARHLMNRSGNLTTVPLLPAMFSLKGDPLTTKDHFPLDILFRTRMPLKSLMKTARQVGKSQTLATRGVLQSNSIPHFTTICITPLYEQIRRFSANYVQPLIETSPFSYLMYGPNTTNSVLQRTFLNHSKMMFSFAWINCERVRGSSGDLLQLDEIQNMNEQFLPIIRETIVASRHGKNEMSAGTPLTLDNLIERLWLQTTQSEYGIRCDSGGCGHWNIPSIHHDLDAMTGPWHRDISEKTPAIICRKCRKPLYARRNGRWIHGYKERRWDYLGLHIPQHIMPMHYADPTSWKILLNKRDGFDNTPKFRYYNEVCGESYDFGSKIVTQTDLRRAACLPWRNSYREALEHKGEYLYKVLAIDWGGGGIEMVSWTVYAVMGILPSGEIHVLYGYRSLTPHDHHREASLALHLAYVFGCEVITHDFSGTGGEARENMIVDAGFPLRRLVACALVPHGSGAIMKYKPPTRLQAREYYALDKARSLHLTCNQIKKLRIKFFKYDAGNPGGGVIGDFLGLTTEQVSVATRGDRYVITRVQGRSDDFAQAVNIGACVLWRMLGQFPDLGDVSNMALSPALERELEGPEDEEWRSDGGFAPQDN